MTTLDIEGTLREHTPYARLGQTDCNGCDWSSNDGTSHRAHVAAVLSTQIEGALAEAWDQGAARTRAHEDALSGWLIDAGFDDSRPVEPTNPHRAALPSSDTERAES